MTKKEKYFLFGTCILLSLAGHILFNQPGDSSLTMRNNGFGLPAVFIITYVIVRGGYILLFHKPTNGEVNDYVQRLKDEGKLPADFKNDEDVIIADKKEDSKPPLE